MLPPSVPPVSGRGSVRQVVLAVLPWALPVLVVAGWVVALTATWIALGRPPGPRRVLVEGAASWRDAQAARLACTFSQGWHHAEGPRVWTLCPDDAGVYGIARVDLPVATERATLRRRWPLPETLRVASPVGRETAPQDFLAIEGAHRAPGGHLTLVVSRWRDGDTAVRLLQLADEGGVLAETPLDVKPLSLRGFVARASGHELVFEDGRVLAVRDGVVVEQGRLPGVPEDASVELAAPAATGWDVLWSREVRPAVEGAPGERAVYRTVSVPDPFAAPTSAPEAVGTLATTDQWPFGEYVELAAGNVVNGYLPGMKRLRGTLEPVPPVGSPPADRGMLLIYGPSAFLAAEGRMDSVRTLMDGSFAFQVLRVHDEWIWLHAVDGGLAVSKDPGVSTPVVVSGWQPMNPWVAEGPDGALWLADATGAYVLLNRDLRRADPPGALERVAAVVAGDRTQFASHSSSAPDGLEASALLRAQLRRSSLPVALGGPPVLVLLVILARLPSSPRLSRSLRWAAQIGCAAWLAGMVALLDPLAAALAVL